MGSFSQEDQILIWQENQQTVWLQPWGVDGLRVQATLTGERFSLPQALLEPAPAVAVPAAIKLGQEAATIRNESICAKISSRRKVYLPAGTEWMDTKKRNAASGRGMAQRRGAARKRAGLPQAGERSGGNLPARGVNVDRRLGAIHSLS